MSWGRVAEATLDGWTAATLASDLKLPCVEIFDETTSTLDVAHRLGAEGAPPGTLVIADRQTAGRGRSGNKWQSPGGSGLWLALLERPTDTSGLDVLSLRIGLESASALDRFAGEPIGLKWPNDLYVAGRKLGGILIEARWREQRLEWVAIGIGINVLAPIHISSACGLDAGTRRHDVLAELVPCLRQAAMQSGILTDTEVSTWNARDIARGRACSQPASGTVRGISSSGELIVALADSVARFRSGSLVLSPPQ